MGHKKGSQESLDYAAVLSDLVSFSKAFNIILSIFNFSYAK